MISMEENNINALGGFLANQVKRGSPVKVRVSEIVVSTFCKTVEKHTTT